jgi:hypothetical protein
MRKKDQRLQRALAGGHARAETLRSALCFRREGDLPRGPFTLVSAHACLFSAWCFFLYK